MGGLLEQRSILTARADCRAWVAFLSMRRKPTKAPGWLWLLLAIITRSTSASAPRAPRAQGVAVDGTP